MIRYELLSECYREGAVECIARSFFENDVLGVALGIGFGDWRSFSCGVVEKSIEDKVSLVALDGNDVVGANLCYDFDRYSPDDYNVIESFMPISEFMNCLYDGYDVPGRVLHFSYIGVISDYSRKGLALNMARENINIANEMDYDKIILEASSPYSQKNGFKLGFKKVKEIFYKDFRYKNQKVFERVSDVNSCLLMELRL